MRLLFRPVTFWPQTHPHTQVHAYVYRPSCGASVASYKHMLQLRHKYKPTVNRTLQEKQCRFAQLAAQVHLQGA
jgi:hypothetical protein